MNIKESDHTVPKKPQYVNNKDLLDCIIKWKAAAETAKDAGLPEPPMPDYLATSIMKITEGLAKRPNFSGYSFIEEMQEDALLSIIKYWRNFDPSKSSNPFAYFTTISNYAFIHRISVEKKNALIKRNLMGSKEIFENNIDKQKWDTRKYCNVALDRTQREFDKNYNEDPIVEELPKPKVKRAVANMKRLGILDSFMEEEETVE